MKKFLALTLTLAMASAMLPAAVSAAEDAPLFKVGGNRGDWEITNGSDYTCYSRPGAPNFGLYVLGNAEEVTLSADLTAGNEYGFMFGITDANSDGSIAETGDQYYLVDFRTDGSIGIERNDKEWGTGWADQSEVVAAAGETVTVTATYTKDADGVKIVVSAGGNEVLTYEDSDPFAGVAYGLASKSGEALKNVVAPDLPGSEMSQALIADVIANKPHIAYKTGSASSTGEIKAARATGAIETELENLFDYDADKVMVQNDPNEMTRFCVQYGGDKTQSITWETEEAEVAKYIVIYTGPNCTNINRSMTTYTLYGSTDGETWDQIALAGRLHLKRANTISGLHLDNDTAYSFYKITFTFDQDEVESYGIHLYADPTASDETTEGGNTEPEVEIVTETQTGVADESNKWTVEKKYFAVSYTIPLAETHDHADNGCCGIIFGGTDDYLCVYMQHEIVDGKNTSSKSVHVGPWWGNNNRNYPEYPVISDDDFGKDGTVLVLGSQEDGKLTISAIYFNGVKIDEFTGLTLEGFNGKIGYATKITGVTATIKFAEADTELDATVFDEKQPGTPGGNNPGGQTPNPAPTTGSASIVIAAVAVISLAGVIVATKKREQE